MITKFNFIEWTLFQSKVLIQRPENLRISTKLVVNFVQGYKLQKG